MRKSQRGDREGEEETHPCDEADGTISARQVGEEGGALGECSIREVALELSESGRCVLRRLGIRGCLQRTGRDLPRFPRRPWMPQQLVV